MLLTLTRPPLRIIDLLYLRRGLLLVGQLGPSSPPDLDSRKWQGVDVESGAAGWSTTVCCWACSIEGSRGGAAEPHGSFFAISIWKDMKMHPGTKLPATKDLTLHHWGWAFWTSGCVHVGHAVFTYLMMAGSYNFTIILHYYSFLSLAISF